MKPGQLIEYNLRNSFLEKWYIKVGRETISIPLNQYSKVLYILFLLFATLRTIKIDWN